ncbi:MULTISPECIES: ABC transporter ATP-binding protein [unclassified Mesorhizobium]|uniref:ABC transporter ATP-binding protein n=1 Tax=unclassified Mesorhizobium TaxID=325217 RepID=UPI001CCC5C77|nr:MULTISPECIES: sn-glycerol-3-phosphate ABC transporter ATP-binding protein UgpC [unclassified Mesorhizobium]MBZ9841447.1 sn-glycerol-3-phosphate ABC transporter ATP-binding protein UgpC [Mesorhizobium sp. CA5]MBZ9864654.1 sn-glycerol-3-phosphate ABC transporter ATP-binding protein UgpC [Mesorhizobium sp. CA15]MBZ9910590.1 sn-glycerol-3-phosphate ABC transporter ATP-binding protein UgpC [Mesorhizobium sp. CA16]
MSAIEIEQLGKSFGAVEVLRDVNIEIASGEFVVLVGPSGCGKSTLLRIIAGLEEHTTGEIRIGGRVVDEMPAKSRDIAMVFQSYALYPHMSVADNMSFALRLAKVPREEIVSRVKAAAEILGLQDLLGRMPRQLSGGQRQRVAMGRAIVRDPAAFLFDEPLSNLDAKLRVKMRAEIKKLHQRLGRTSIYVTHDQTEAMTLADRIVVLNKGRIEQIGTPSELYDNPANLFVAGFIGSPEMNLINGRIQSGAFIAEQGLRLPLPHVAGVGDKQGVVYGIRPQHIAVGGNHAQARVQVVEPTGEAQEITLTADGVDLMAEIRDRPPFKPDQEVNLEIMMHKVHLFDAESGRRIN